MKKIIIILFSISLVSSCGEEVTKNAPQKPKTETGRQIKEPSQIRKQQEKEYFDTTVYSISSNNQQLFIKFDEYGVQSHPIQQITLSLLMALQNGTGYALDSHVETLDLLFLNNHRIEPSEGLKSYVGYFYAKAQEKGYELTSIQRAYCIDSSGNELSPEELLVRMNKYL